MVPGGQLRDHAAVFGMELDLAVEMMGQQSPLGVVHRRRRLVAGGFYSEDSHGAVRPPFIAENMGLPLIFHVRLITLARSQICPKPLGRDFSRDFIEVAMPSVRVRENEYFDAALRRFKRACEKAGVLTELRRREFYEKPTQERKRKKAAAVKRHMKRMTRDVGGGVRSAARPARPY